MSNTMSKLYVKDSELSSEVRDHLGDLNYDYLVQYTENGEVFIVDNNIVAAKKLWIGKLVTNVKRMAIFCTPCLMLIASMLLFIFSYTNDEIETKQQAILIFPILALAFIGIISLFACEEKLQSYGVEKIPLFFYLIQKDNSKENYYELTGVLKKGIVREHVDKAQKLIVANNSSPYQSKDSEELYTLWKEVLFRGEDDLAIEMFNRDFYKVYNNINYEPIYRNLRAIYLYTDTYTDSDIRKVLNTIPYKKENQKSVKMNTTPERTSIIKKLLGFNNMENSKNTSNSYDSSSTSDNLTKVNVYTVEKMHKDFSDLSNRFTDFQTNPETIIYKPLLLDVTYYHTQKMLNDYSKVEEMIKTLEYGDSKQLSDIRDAIQEAHKSFTTAENEALKVGIPNVSDNSRKKAIKSLNIVLDPHSYEEEKIAHWEGIIKIVRSAGMKEEIINKANNKILLEIRNNKKLEITR